MIKVLITDDDSDAADALKRNIDGRDGIVIVGIAKNGKIALDMCSTEKPDIILMDIRMPVMDGIEASQRIKSQFPSIKIVILTLFREEENIVNALKADCVGYIYKGHLSEDIILILKNINLGMSVFENKANEMLKDRVNVGFSDRSELKKLTDREIEIVTLVTSGKKDNEIAAFLFLDSGYVRNCLQNIRSKLNFRTTKELAVWGARMGL